MSHEWATKAALALLALSKAGPAAAEPVAFDGRWVTTVTCPNTSGALGYSFEVPTEVQGGVLHGERLKDGEPGHLVLDGKIQTDGQALLYARGLVGAAPFAVGQRPKGVDYGYHVNAHFQGGQGAGSRVEGRRCDLNFVRQ